MPINNPALRLAKDIFITILVLCVFWFVHYRLPEIDGETKKQLSQAGLWANLFGAIFMSFRFINLKKYKAREIEIKNEIQKSPSNNLNAASEYILNCYIRESLPVNLLDKELDKIESKSQQTLEKLNKELDNISNLDSAESMYITAGLILIAISTVLQIFGTS